MKIAYNPKTANALLLAPSNNDITFDLPGLAIYARGIKFDGKTPIVFKKHTSTNAGGYNGLVPVPSYTTTTTRYLREDGTWTTPPDSHWTTHLYIGAKDVANNKATTNGNTYIKVTDNSTIRNQYLIKGSGNISVSSDDNGNININSPTTISWNNITDKPSSFTPSTHYHPTSQINALTGYTKGTSASDLTTTDTLNAALGKLEYKSNYTYNWIISVTASDTDEYINKWGEIVGFLDSVKEGTDILDEFVTRKTAQTIIGTKIFNNGDQSPITVARASSDLVSIKFDGLSGVLGYLGFSGVDQPIYRRTSDNAYFNLLHSGNSTVTGGGSTWGSKITVTINGVSKTLTIPSNPDTWRPITNEYNVTSPSSTTSLSQAGAKSLYDTLLNGYASQAGNSDTIDSYHISVGSTAGTNTNTIYFVI